MSSSGLNHDAVHADVGKEIKPEKPRGGPVHPWQHHQLAVQGGPTLSTHEAGISSHRASPLSPFAQAHPKSRHDPTVHVPHPPSHAHETKTPLMSSKDNIQSKKLSPQKDEKDKKDKKDKKGKKERHSKRITTSTSSHDLIVKEDDDTHVDKPSKTRSPSLLPTTRSSSFQPTPSSHVQDGAQANDKQSPSASSDALAGFELNVGHDDDDLFCDHESLAKRITESVHLSSQIALSGALVPHDAIVDAYPLRDIILDGQQMIFF